MSRLQSQPQTSYCSSTNLELEFTRQNKLIPGLHHTDKYKVPKGADAKGVDAKDVPKKPH